MSYKINVKAEAGEQLITVIKGSNRKVKDAIATYGVAMAEAVSSEIIQSIAQIPTIGPFLAVRTRVETIISGGTITLLVQGMSEGEAGNPPVSGGEPSDETNLWLAHEFGKPSDGHTTKTSFHKDVGGVTATREGVSHGAGSPYVGVIRNKISTITVQLEGICAAIAGIAASNIAADIVHEATGGKVKVDRSAQASLKRAGISASLLATLGVNKVSVSPSGQINLIGSNAKGGHFFISGKNAGIPTTIHR